MTRERLAVFDVCDTLYACNTTAAFISYFLESVGDRSGARAVAAFRRKWSPVFWVDVVFRQLAARDFARDAMLRRLAGMPRNQLTMLADRFSSDVLPAKANVQLHDALSRHVERGDGTLLLSNSLDVVVQAIGKALSVEWVASTLAYKDEVCEGRLLRDLQGRKHEALRAFLGERHPHIVVYTDNTNDRPLLEIADERNVVIPKGKSKDRWGRIDASFITL